MVEVKSPDHLRPFQRGFAHLALRAPVDQVAILPVAIASIEEETHQLAPLQLFRLADPSEPLFESAGWHAAIVYRRVQLLFGLPIIIDDLQRQQYRGRQAGLMAQELTDSCRHQIVGLLRQGCS